MNGVATNLTLTGTEFLISNLIVNFTLSGGSTTSVTIQPTTTLSTTVAVPSAIQSVNAGTVVSITVTNSDDRTSGGVNKTVVTPTGGTISTSGNFRIHTFNTSDNFVTTLGTDVEYLIIAGGASGGGYYYVDGWWSRWWL